MFTVFLKEKCYMCNRLGISIFESFILNGINRDFQRYSSAFFSSSYGNFEYSYPLNNQQQSNRLRNDRQLSTALGGDGNIVY